MKPTFIERNYPKLAWGFTLALAALGWLLMLGVPIGIIYWIVNR